MPSRLFLFYERGDKRKMKTTYKRWGISIILSMMLLLIPFFIGPQMQSYAAQKWN